MRFVDPGKDDFRELSELLFGAKDRYRSARAKITHTVVGVVAEESNRRFVDWRFAQPGGSGMGKLRTEEERRAHGPDVPRDFYLEYEDAERVVRLWHERPDRWREDWSEAEGTLLRSVVAAGRHAPLWIYEPPHTAIHVPSVPERRDPDPKLAFMLDPSEESFYWALADDATTHKTGRRATVAGREALEVEIGTVSWGYPPRIFRDFYAPDGTTDHLLLVDAEVGTILRAAARLEGREFYVAEITEIAYDETFPEDTFRLELPGVEFRWVDR
ncbi:MAG: hypothetical protein M3R38_33015 [Actinomycetota bacterium]|nr:hypothetical protein [Actinomycetota bacterium]